MDLRRACPEYNKHRALPDMPPYSHRCPFAEAAVARILVAGDLHSLAVAVDIHHLRKQAGHTLVAVQILPVDIEAVVGSIRHPAVLDTLSRHLNNIRQLVGAEMGVCTTRSKRLVSFEQDRPER